MSYMAELSPSSVSSSALSDPDHLNGKSACFYLPWFHLIKMIAYASWTFVPLLVMRPVSIGFRCMDSQGHSDRDQRNSSSLSFHQLAGKFKSRSHARIITNICSHRPYHRRRPPHSGALSQTEAAGHFDQKRTLMNCCQRN